MELSETKIKIFCNFAAYCRNNIFVLPMKIRLFTIPNLLTLASLLCGSFAVVSALVYGDLALAFWLTIAAGVFDYSDGAGHVVAAHFACSDVRLQVSEFCF